MSFRDYVGKKIKVGYDGVFDFNEFYKVLVKWSDHYRYDWIESESKVKPKEDGKEIYIKWNLERKVSDYVKFHIDIDIWGSKIKEGIIKGKKKRINKGQVTVRFSSWIERDYENNWGKPFLSFIRDIYDKLVQRDRYKECEDSVYEEVHRIVEEVKKFFDIHEFK